MTLNVSLANFDVDSFRAAIASEIGVDVSRIAVTRTEEIVDPFVCTNCAAIDFTYVNYSGNIVS